MMAAMMQARFEVTGPSSSVLHRLAIYELARLREIEDADARDDIVEIVITPHIQADQGVALWRGEVYAEWAVS